MDWVQDWGTVKTHAAPGGRPRRPGPPHPGGHRVDWEQDWGTVKTLATPDGRRPPRGAGVDWVQDWGTKKDPGRDGAAEPRLEQSRQIAIIQDMVWVETPTGKVQVSAAHAEAFQDPRWNPAPRSARQKLDRIRWKRAYPEAARALERRP